MKLQLAWLVIKASQRIRLMKRAESYLRRTGGRWRVGTALLQAQNSEPQEELISFGGLFYNFKATLIGYLRTERLVNYAHSEGYMPQDVVQHQERQIDRLLAEKYPLSKDPSRTFADAIRFVSRIRLLARCFIFEIKPQRRPVYSFFVDKIQKLASSTVQSSDVDSLKQSVLKIVTEMRNHMEEIKQEALQYMLIQQRQRIEQARQSNFIKNWQTHQPTSKPSGSTYQQSQPNSPSGESQGAQRQADPRTEGTLNTIAQQRIILQNQLKPKEGQTKVRRVRMKTMMPQKPKSKAKPKMKSISFKVRAQSKSAKESKQQTQHREQPALFDTNSQYSSHRVLKSKQQPVKIGPAPPRDDASVFKRAFIDRANLERQRSAKAVSVKQPMREGKVELGKRKRELPIHAQQGQLILKFLLGIRNYPLLEESFMIT